MCRPLETVPDRKHASLAARLRVASAVGARAANDSDLVWRANPRAWHQQIARIVDHRFTTFDELARFSRDAKRAGVSVVMLVQVQKTAACPGWWYNGLQLCDHINGTVPAADGTLTHWQALVAELRPMRFMWWTNRDYWSTQGPVWAQAAAAPRSDVGAWFSWNASDADECWGHNPDGAQGSWGSDNSFEGEMSALASWGSAAYAEYPVDAMANSRTRNLGVDGYCIDASAATSAARTTARACCRSPTATPRPWRAITRRCARASRRPSFGRGVRLLAEVIGSGSDIGGQGGTSFTSKCRRRSSPATSAAWRTPRRRRRGRGGVLCYLDAAFDGEAPGACPTMYSRRDVDDANARSTKCGSRRGRVGHRAAARLRPRPRRGGM